MQTERSVLSLLQSTDDMQDLQGRVAILTGGSCGIGHEIARTLVKHNCQVLLVNNQSIDSILAIISIEEELASSKPLISHIPCDMSNLCQVQTVFSTLVGTLPRVDLCIFSTGIDVPHFQSDVNCIDSYFGMIWLGHFYACNLLWPLIRRTCKMPNTPPPRIIFEAPEEQFPEPCGSLESDDMEADELSRVICEEIYQRSRTTLVLGIRYGLAERIVQRHGDNIFVVAVQPGNAGEDKVRRDSHSGGDDWFGDKFLEALDEIDGARGRSKAILYAATSRDVETDYMNGAYLVDVATRGDESDLAADPSLGPGFWDISERAIKAVVGKDAIVPWDTCME